jgi:hypothetical protein
MRFLLRALLILHALFEIGVAGVMLIQPTFFFIDIAGISEAGPAVSSLGRSFGFGALAMAALSILMTLRDMTPEMRYVGFGTLMVFHLGLTIAHLINVVNGLTTVVIVAIHGSFALLFLSMFLWVATRE